ncbi:MAG: hypothetical protein AAFZ52_18820, partial [Bacteroidota bacterium]
PADPLDDFTMRPGSRLRISVDSVSLTPPLMDPIKQRLITPEELSDSSGRAIALDLLASDHLLVKTYFNDSLFTTREFVPLDTSARAVPWSELAGFTYHVAKTGFDSSRVYFGYAEKMIFRPEGGHYLLAGGPAQQAPISKVIAGDGSGGLFHAHEFLPRPLEGKMILLGKKEKGALGKEPFTVYRDQAGTLTATYVTPEKDRYQRHAVPLVPFHSGVNATTSLEEFAARISTGKLTVDTSYPPADSADVRYYFDEAQERKGGIPFDELDQLILDFNPNGEYYILVGKRLIRNGRWRLSPDNNYLITLGKDELEYLHYPILRYDEEVVELRMPLLVGTREPRGVELISYVVLDAFVRIER